MKIQYSKRVDTLVFGHEECGDFTAKEWALLAYAALDQLGAYRWQDDPEGYAEALAKDARSVAKAVERLRCTP